ncbi:MAG: ADP-ribose diphosphatase [Alphaproteobacteria bacterium]
MPTGIRPRPSLTNDDNVDMRKITRTHDGFFALDVHNFRFRRFDGNWSVEIEREVFERGHGVSVIPYDPVRDEVILVEQFRLGAHLADMDAWLLEVVAGILDKDMSDEDTVRAEAKEEADLTLTHIEKVQRFILSPGGSPETNTLYCGICSTEGKEGGIHGVAAEEEDIKTHVFKAPELFEMRKRGEITNAITLIAVQWLELNYDRLRAEHGGAA